MLKKMSLFFKLINFNRILKAFSILKKSGISEFKYHFFLVKDKENSLIRNNTIYLDILDLNEFDNINKYNKIILKKHKNPKVSIIIPVFNNFSYTYNCLCQIKKNTINIPYEVIIADDNSTDFTKEIDCIVQGAKIIHNTQNLQFLDNCNNASKYAEGKYILFLNNDTQVQKNWLEPLLYLLERDESVGMAGSKLIYPDGTVQEAGGIVWKNATVLQFGNGRLPDDEELSFVREVDYISAASIIIRKSLWEKIGGFDDCFQPAYYEDVDLAFNIRKRGFKVIFHPLSEVVHFEGITENLTDGRMQKIELNRRQFEKKWSEELALNHYEAKDYPILVKKIVNTMYYC